MDQVDVEMEDAGKVLEDEVMGGEEGAEKEQIDVTEVQEKQDEPSVLVNDDVKSPNEIGVEQEEQKVEEKPEEQEAEAEAEPKEQRKVEEKPEELYMEDAKEMHTNKSEQESPVNEAQENVKDATVMGDDKIDDAGNNATENGEDDTTDDHKNDVKEIGEDGKIDDSKNDDAAEIGDGDKIDDSNDGVTEIGQEDKIDVNIDDATETGSEDKIDGRKKDDALAMEGDTRIHDGKNDATDMDNDHGVIDTENDGSKNIPENNEGGNYTMNELHQQLVTHNAVVKNSPSEVEDRTVMTLKNEVEETEMDDGYDSGTPEAQEAFMQEVLALYKTKHLKFTVPKFYGRYLNCLKLWKAVIRLGGYDRVTATKGWRYVGEAFRPPKTCTTVSWTFRQFYEKSLLEYERHKVQTGEIELPLTPGYPETPTVEPETNGHQTPTGSGRARRDAAARAMQGWHSHRLLGFGEEKNSNNSQKREKSLKSLGSLKHKRQSEVEHSVKALRTETSRQLVTTVADIGPPANWVKINVRETKDCFEVYALVPGLLREEVRVQSDPAGRLVITGQPEQLDNPWGISSFKKVISLPARIDPLRTSAIVSLHGRLLVKVPFEQSNL
nr:AT-rich interactive domain-containing protein 5-like isoform X1 [Tanacetum cinerariifolium]